MYIYTGQSVKEGFIDKNLIGAACTTYFGLIVLSLSIGLAGGAMQVGAYWIIIWALALAPMGMVSALRETSVLFVALISTFILKEGFGVWRFVSASLVSFGLMLTRDQK